MSLNSALFTVSAIDGDTSITSYQKLFMANRVVSAQTVGSVAVVDYLDSPDRMSRYTLTATLSAFNAGLNNPAPSGTVEQVGILDAGSGLAIGTHDLVDENGNDVTFPNNSRILFSIYEVVTTFTSATDAATIALGVETDDAAGIVAAVAISGGGNVWDAGGFVVGIQDDTITNASEKTTASGRKLQAVVATEALTAGKLYVYTKAVTTGT